MKYSVQAYWGIGIIGWLLANTTGKFHWKSNGDNTKTWLFENGEDAIAFKLKFGL